VILGTPPPVYPWPIGPGPRYQPAARPAAGLTCANGRRFAVHVELFANRRVIVVPRGIGLAPGGCRAALSTDAPTGVVHVLAGRRYTLADLFRVWGRTLSASQLLSFRGRVSVFVGGRRFTGDPRTVPLTRHAEIVVETGGYVAPHVDYLFPKGIG
jgi:hypothetical protein